MPSCWNSERTRLNQGVQGESSTGVLLKGEAQGEEASGVMVDQSNRSIQIQESAVGSAIVSGDGNTIYVIHQTTQQRQEITTETTAQLGPNPYKGLAAFTEQDGDRYFGREAQVERLWERFQRLLEQSTVPRLLPILGPSGSGKSSLGGGQQPGFWGWPSPDS